MGAIKEHETIDPEVFDLLFDDNTDNKGESKQSDANAANDDFYAFDFGVSEKENEKENGAIQPNKSSDSSSSADSSSDRGEGLVPPQPNSSRKAVKLSPPTKQANRSKKNRRNSKSASANGNGNADGSENQRAFESLHKQFDPSLVGTVPVGQIAARAKQQMEKKAAQKGKRHTEPSNIHSERQKQLKEEGLIRSPRKEKKEKKGIAKAEDSDEKASAPKKSKAKKGAPKKKSSYNVLPELHRGTALLKYGRRGYPHFRQFNLTADNEHMRWFSSKKKLQQSSICVGDIDEILTGQHTKEFRRIAWTTLTPASFSIIYQNKKKSLNLVAKSVDEMKMWVEALRRLRDMKRRGDKGLATMESLMVDVDFRDRNRPQSRHHSGNFLRSHETKEREVDPVLQRKLIDDIAALRKQFIEISREANNPIIQSTKEYESIEQILSELEERVEELDHEVRHTRNTKIAENDVWRTRIDLESLREKIKVITKQHKAEYKNSKRRWSVF